MSKIVRVSESNYKVQVKSGGTITFDTGTDVGTTVITGDLLVKGNTSTINTTNTNIEDNIITLNSGESPLYAGVREGSAGIEVDRGSRVKSKLVFDETVEWYKPASGTFGELDYVPPSYVPGTWLFKGGLDSSITTGIQVASVATDGTSNLVFDLQNSARVLEIGNTNAESYSLRLQDPDPLNPDPAKANYIPNKQFINDYVSSGIAVPGQADVDRIYKKFGGLEKARVQTEVTGGGVGSIGMYINLETIPTVKVTSGNITVNDSVNLTTDTVTTISTNNLLITAANGNVSLDAVFNFDDQTSSATPIAGITKVYSSATKGAGRTNLYIATTRPREDGTSTVDISDELVAKNRALLFSMLF